MLEWRLSSVEGRVNNITIEFMFAGINMFWARLRLLSKMSLRRAQNIFMPKNILNSITINITLEGTEKIKTEKNDNKTLGRTFFPPVP